MTQPTLTLDPAVRAAVEAAEITDTTVKLWPQQVRLTTILPTLKALEAAGGKWDRNNKLYKFDGSPREILGLTTESDLMTKKLNRDQNPKPSSIQPFPSPDLAVYLAELTQPEKGLRVLVAGAGTDDIAAALLARGTDQGYVWCCEEDLGLADKLRTKGNPVWEGSFLKTPASMEMFDRILAVAEPPGAVAWLNHAINLLRPGGRLAMVTTTAWLEDTAAATTELRDTLKRMDGEIEELPQGSMVGATEPMIVVLATRVKLAPAATPETEQKFAVKLNPTPAAAEPPEAVGPVTAVATGEVIEPSTEPEPESGPAAVPAPTPTPAPAPAQPRATIIGTF